MRAFWKRDREFSELEGELRARRAEPAARFVRALAESVEGERSRARPRLRVALTLALVVLGAAAVASQGGISLAASGTEQVVQVVADLTSSSSSPQTTVDSSSANDQYNKPGKGCGDPNHAHDRNFECKASMGSVGQKEGNTGVTAFDFTISLDKTPLSTITAAWTTAPGGTATAGTDYQTNSGVVTFAPGIQTQTARVYVVGDLVPEKNEVFYVNLTSVTGNAYIGTGTGVGTIQNDD